MNMPLDTLSIDAPLSLDALRGLEDEALMEEAQLGSHDAFAELVRRHTPRVYRVALGILRDAGESEDTVQQTFINVFRALDSFRATSRPGTWIYRIAVNTALMRRRKLMRRREVPAERTSNEDGETWSIEAVDDELPGEAAERAQLRDAILRAADELDEKYRVVFQLRDLDGRSIAETAELLDMTEAAVKTRLHRARLFLRSSLEHLA